MYSHSIKKLPKNTYEIKVTIPQADIKQHYGTSFEKLKSDLTVEGFRKGKVPMTIAQKHISTKDVYSQLIKDLIPDIYSDIVKKANLKPIIYPKVDLTKAQENEDWQVEIQVAEKPLIELGDYKKVVKEAKDRAKKADIWVPGKDPDEKKPPASSQESLNEVMSALLKNVKIEVSDLILEQELQQRLTKLVDDIQRIGMSVDSYLKSKNISMEDLKNQFKMEIEETYKLEFMLAEIADVEKLEVEKADLDKLFAHIKTEKERKEAEANAYFYATVIRKQKTIDYLLGL